MDANTTRWARSVSLKDMQGPVFIQNGGHMSNLFGRDGKEGSFGNKSKGMVQKLFSFVR